MIYSIQLVIFTYAACAERYGCGSPERAESASVTDPIPLQTIDTKVRVDDLE